MSTIPSRQQKISNADPKKNCQLILKIPMIETTFMRPQNQSRLFLKCQKKLAKYVEHKVQLGEAPSLHPKSFTELEKYRKKFKCYQRERPLKIILNGPIFFFIKIRHFFVEEYAGITHILRICYLVLILLATESLELFIILLPHCMLGNKGRGGVSSALTLDQALSPLSIHVII